MGHGPIFICRTLQYMHAHAVPLGVLPEMDGASAATLTMRSGDMVLLITDGFFEWENLSQEQFRTAGLAEAFESSTIANPKSSPLSSTIPFLISPRGRRRKTI